MLNFFQIMAAEDCNGIGPVIAFIKYGVFPIIQIGIPILLILFGTLDLGKAVVSNDDKEIKGATSKLVKRAIMAVAVFFVTLLVSVVLGWITNTGEGGKTADGIEYSSNWKECWQDPRGTSEEK